MSEHYAISAVRDGFRRAGRQWGRKAEIVPAADLTPDQLEALRADESITITPCAADGPPEPGTAADLAVRAGATVAELRDALIRAGIGTLEPGREDHWTGPGLPEVAALRTATGLASISAAERDRVWGEIQQGA